MTLSNLPSHPFREPALEQYGTDGETAARWLYSINSEEPFGDTDGIIDLGAGNGILGIGALLLGAPNAIFVEIDEEVCKSLQDAIASIHLLHGRGARHIESWAESSGWFAKRWMEVDLPMPPIYSHHTKKRSTSEAAMWWIKRSAN